jgi:endogenous inhibitor of DNA gyrase (YacG/DUF329 family)
MGVVMIKCPTTGRDVTTGIDTDQITFDGLPDVLSHSRCPVCGLEHAWSKREAHLAEPGCEPINRRLAS